MKILKFSLFGLLCGVLLLGVAVAKSGKVVMPSAVRLSGLEVDRAAQAAQTERPLLLPDANQAKPGGLLAMLDESLVEVQLQPEKKKPTKPPVVAPPTCADGSCSTTVSDSGDEEGRGKGRIRAFLKRIFHRRGGEGRGGCGVRGRLRGGC